MPIGYEAADFVWSTDKTTGRAAPRKRTLIGLEPGRYMVDETHPVVDARGVLLPGKHTVEKGSQPADKATPKPTDTKTAKEA